MTDVIEKDGLKFLNTKTAPALVEEILADNYEVLKKGITFQPGDVILDLGANEGVFSILMARHFPETRILAYEPIPATYETLLRNIELNGCVNIEPFRLGVGRPGESQAVFNVSKDFSGGSTSVCRFNPQDHYTVTAPLASLDDIFGGIQRCRLLKVDIEGMEYDALYAFTKLNLVDYMAIEVHTNSLLDYQGRRADGLITWLGNQVELIHVDLCRMTE